MNINEILNGNYSEFSVEEQKEVLNEMKERKLFDLSGSERLNLIDFLCEKADENLTIDYLFHVLDSEISYPIDDDKVKTLFSDERMKRIKDVMLERLEDNTLEDEVDSDDKIVENENL